MGACIAVPSAELVGMPLYQAEALVERGRVVNETDGRCVRKLRWILEKEPAPLTRLECQPYRLTVYLSSNGHITRLGRMG